MTKPKNEFDLPSPSFLDQVKLKEQEAKIESGERYAIRTLQKTAKVVADNILYL